MTAAPREWVIDGTWPTGRLAPDAPAAATKLSATAMRVADVVTHLGAAAVANGAGVDPVELDDLLTGAAWPTVHLIVGLETVLGESLW